MIFFSEAYRFGKKNHDNNAHKIQLNNYTPEWIDYVLVKAREFFSTHRRII